ncbi:MAG: hypothetical protein E7671_01965 [Ruminococcaceae bacterium]|nr:hypothetical protein [Oscillospiraceae bacterium]
MKKIVLFIALLVAFSVPSSAIENLSPPRVNKGIDCEGEYETFISGIPEEIVPFLPEGIFSGSIEDGAEAAKELTAPESFFKVILNMLGFRIKDAFLMLARLIAIVLLSSLATTMLKSVCGEVINEAFSFCSAAVIVTAITLEQAGLIKMVHTFLERLLAFVNSMIPIMGALYAAGGNVSTAASSTSSLGFFIAVCENLCAYTLMPIVGICLAFSAASAFSSEVSLGEISGNFKKVYTYGLGLLMAVLALVMGVQNHLSAKADSLGARAAKYAVGSFIPIVGGTVGDSLRTVAASVEYIRSSVGGIAIAVILLLLLPSLISLALGRGAINISAMLAKMLGCEREGKLLSEISNVYGYMIAVSSICSVLFIYVLTLFVKCSAAAGG